jgi:hypothetical protein
MTRYWFKPKRYGYGATPVTWEGWAFTGLVVAIVAGSGWLLLGTGRTPDWTMLLVWWAIVALMLAVSVVVSKSRTEGSWRWRWGHDT